MTVRELLEAMDSHEIAEWMAYEKVEPFGEARADLRSAIVAHTIASLWSKHPPDLEAFMPYLEKQAQTFDDMKSIVARARRQALPTAKEK